MPRSTPARGEVLGSTVPRHTSDEFAAFLATVAETQPHRRAIRPDLAARLIDDANGLREVRAIANNQLIRRKAQRLQGMRGGSITSRRDSLIRVRCLSQDCMLRTLLHVFGRRPFVRVQQVIAIAFSVGGLIEVFHLHHRSVWQNPLR